MTNLVRTDFVHWYALEDTKEKSPQEAGVFQIRIVKGLLDYPTGKSAMVCYGQADNLSEVIAKVAAEQSEGDFLCRHQSTEQSAVLLEFVLGQFERRFGKPPTWPTML